MIDAIIYYPSVICTSLHVSILHTGSNYMHVGCSLAVAILYQSFSSELYMNRHVFASVIITPIYDIIAFMISCLCQIVNISNRFACKERKS